MKDGLMMAIALDVDYDALNTLSEEITDFVSDAVSRTYNTPDNEYVVYYWGEWELSEKAYCELRSYLDTVRHRYIEVKEDSIIRDNKSEDEWGCDGEFDSDDMLCLKPAIQFFETTYEEDDN